MDKSRNWRDVISGSISKVNPRRVTCILLVFVAILLNSSTRLVEYCEAEEAQRQEELTARKERFEQIKKQQRAKILTSAGYGNTITHSNDLPVAGAVKSVEKRVKADIQQQKITAVMSAAVENVIPPKTELELTQEFNLKEAAVAGYYKVYGRSFATITASEYEDLCHIMMAEEESGSDEAQQAVGDVVLNRVESEQFPNDIHSVIWQKSGRTPQFSPTIDGRINLEPSERVRKNALEVLNGPILPANALYFTSCGWFKWAVPYKTIEGPVDTMYIMLAK